MPLRIRDAGTLRTISKLSIQVAGVRRTIRALKVMDGGQLRTVALFAQPLSLGVSSAHVFSYTIVNSPSPAFITTHSVTATPTGGSGPYTYAWQIVSGEALTINSATKATTSFFYVQNEPGTYYSNARCTVTDAWGQTATTNVEITIEIYYEF